MTIRPLGTTVIGQLLLDALFDSYVDWQDACAEVGRAYARWRDGGVTRARAFAEYSAALDVEQRACEAYAGLMAAGMAAR
jgi:hypothetical protein